MSAQETAIPGDVLRKGEDWTDDKSIRMAHTDEKKQVRRAKF